MASGGEAIGPSPWRELPRMSGSGIRPRQETHSAVKTQPEDARSESEPVPAIATTG